MSGITGLMNLDRKPIDPSELESMNALLSHRGPDGGRIWYSSHVGLGHQKLVATPESQYEWMPLANGQGSFMLTADARIDNRDELISRLSIPATRGVPITDADIILAAYGEWGEKCAEKLIGALLLSSGMNKRDICIAHVITTG